MTASNFSSVTITPYPLPPTFGLVDLFERVSHQSGALLFDTAGSTKSDGRYNIMLWSPYKMVTAKHGNKVQVRQCDGTHFESDLLPFEATNYYLHSLVKTMTLSEKLDTEYDGLPFMVGVAGFSGYDTGRYYEGLPDSASDDYTLPDFAMGLYLQSLIEDTLTGCVYYCSAEGHSTPVDLPECPPYSSNDAPFAITNRWVSNLLKADYVSCIARIHDYLHAGDCYQVNMAQRFTAPYTGNPWQAYRQLRESNQAPFSAYICFENSAVMSISPERFIRVTKGKVETKPIKGTRPRFSDEQKDKASAQSLINAEKDRAENLMIVDLLRNDISKHCKPHSVKVPSLFCLESYHAVHHLVSTITGELNDSATPLDLIASSFPGGSITGAPKIRAMEIIDELEQHRRNIYCGSIMYMGFREDLDSSICIRTILAENNQLHCWAGGGIVLDSVADEEYKETLDKVSKILPVLTLSFGCERDKN